MLRSRKKKAFFIAFSFLCAVSFFWLKPSRPYIGIIGDDSFCGERELSWRIKRAAENLGWKAYLDEKRGYRIKKKKHFDWVISTVPQHRECSKYTHNYAALLHPPEVNQMLLFEENTKHYRPFSERYQGYLVTLPPEKKFEDYLESKNKKYFSRPFYPTIQYVEYVKVPLDNIMAMIAVWGNRLDDEKFKHLYSLLSDGGFTKFYGVNNHEIIAQENYLGRLPFDGISVIQALQKHGISLVFHSDVHNEKKIPSSRIFEAAAASTVIICDNNAFVKKYFRDTVFYIDTTLSAEEIYLQIKTCMDTIHNEPQKALDMAKKAHQIFVDQFLMETQLKSIMAMHQEVIQYEKQQKRLKFLEKLRSFF